ncbi:MAG: pyrroline-5-carboxylate reductase [Alphaproteobacteria bacterium]|nr:pyrroline-5-carboxylate reductase [Alphaproteobacteria bacterium]
MTQALAAAGPLVLVGCGKMGGALLQGWLERGLPRDRVHVVEPADDAGRVAAVPGVPFLKSPAGLPAGLKPALVLLAVKPQNMDQVAPLYAAYKPARPVFLSIAAGKRLAQIEGYYGADAAIVRVMPNTPAAVARGMSVLVANRNVPPAGRGLAESLLAAVGETAWIEDEGLMDAVTAVSGSGPAYVFLLIETLAKAGEAAGLPAALSMQLAKATVAGAGELARLAAEPPAQLRVNVTSPGGTTQAALQVLMAADGLQPLMTAAIAAATRRGKELGG